MFGVNEIDALTLSQWMDDDEPVKIVDVRTAGEVQQGIIEGAVFVPMHLIPLKEAEFGADEKVVFYCRSGARSAQVCAFLSQRGVSGIYNLRGGVIGWASSGKRLVAPEPQMMAG